MDLSSEYILKLKKEMESEAQRLFNVIEPKLRSGFDDLAGLLFLTWGGFVATFSASVAGCFNPFRIWSTFKPTDDGSRSPWP